MTDFGTSVQGRLANAIARFKASRDRGVAWLLAHIDGDGRPVGAERQNGWARVPWALAVSGESAAGSAVLAWAEREALGDGEFRGRFRPGVHGGDSRFGAYGLAHFALGAWLLERYDLSLRCMDALRDMQDAATGGVPVVIHGPEHPGLCDLLSTAQVGIAALVSRQDDIIDGVRRWIVDLVDQQRELPRRFYTLRQGAGLVTEPEQAFAWLGVTDFTQPKQTYYTPGITAVFMAGYGMQRGDPDAFALGRRMLALNIEGTAAQFDDPDSVQACKFGWGAAAMQLADPAADYGAHLLRMGDWFIDRQSADGSWAPSRFLSPEPDDVQKLIKTAEHVMEVNAIVSALGKIGADLSAGDG